MNATRIQVPLSLPEPHFEDEATVVSARQVVPLDEARSHDRRRKLLTVAPVLLAAMLCGALGAFAVNYFERRAEAPTNSQPDTISVKDEKVQPLTEPAATASQDVPAETSEPAGAVATSSPAASPETHETKLEQNIAVAKKPGPPSDPRLLVRQRRVHPPSDQPGQNDEPKSRGAARIQDIFSGPNQ